MHLTPDELRELLSLAGFPRSATDVLVARITSDAAPAGDTVVLIFDAQLWQSEMQTGRTALSFDTVTARYLYEQLGNALTEIDSEPPRED